MMLALQLLNGLQQRKVYSYLEGGGSRAIDLPSMLCLGDDDDDPSHRIAQTAIRAFRAGACKNCQSLQQE